MIKFLDLHKQYLSIKGEIDDAVAQVISRSAFIGGVFVDRFEEEFARFQNAEYCIGVGNGTDALEIAIEVLDLPKGSEIVVPANTFISSAEAITRNGCRVVFCDCDANNYTISLDDLKKRITPRTSAIMAVHLYGHPCDMDEVVAIAKEHDLKVVEDCAQAHGAEYKGRRVGAIGDVGTFSFYPGKNLGAYGDGGAIVTNRESIAKKSRMIANHGRIAKYNHEFEGRNSRLDALQASILSVKLKHLESWTQNRIALANIYRDEMKSIDGVILPKCEEWAKHVYHLFVVRLNKRNQLQEFLKDNNVQTGIHYPCSLPKLKAYQYCQQGQEAINANKFDSQILSLPIGDHLERSEVVAVSGFVAAWRAKKTKCLSLVDL